MYVRTLDDVGLGFALGEPTAKKQQPELRLKLTSRAVVYRRANEECRSTNYSVFVPGALRDPNQLDLLIFFHGLLDVCDSKHNYDADNVIKKFQLDTQVSTNPQLALAVPIVIWNAQDRQQGFIRSAWSAAYVNAFVDEVLEQIGNSYGTRPTLGKLILAGHSAAYDILTPLAEQCACGNSETTKGALKKLSRVLALDIPYGVRVAKALEAWARVRPDVKFDLVFSKADPSVGVWKWYEPNRKKLTGFDKAPDNLKVFHKPDFGHCALPPNFLVQPL